MSVAAGPFDTRSKAPPPGSNSGSGVSVVSLLALEVVIWELASTLTLFCATRMIVGPVSAVVFFNSTL